MGRATQKRQDVGIQTAANCTPMLNRLANTRQCSNHFAAGLSVRRKEYSHFPKCPRALYLFLQSSGKHRSHLKQADSIRHVQIEERSEVVGPIFSACVHSKPHGGRFFSKGVEPPRGCPRRILSSWRNCMPLKIKQMLSQSSTSLSS